MKSDGVVGRRFGRLTVQDVVGRDNHGSLRVRCLCDCGKESSVVVYHLLGGSTRSCGCLSRERSTTHGKRNTDAYSSWAHMLSRCSNSSHRSYSDYGGRGITVCERWLKFENFYADMGERPSKSHSLDRIDNNGNYCKENCRWATKKEQSNNQRRNRLIEHDGKTLTLSQWSSVTGLHRMVISNRINRYGWSVEKALTTPSRAAVKHAPTVAVDDILKKRGGQNDLETLP